MPSLKWRLDNLTTAPAKARADLLLAALAHCNPDETEPIARAALASGSPEAVAAVVRLLDQFPRLYDDLLRVDRQTVAAGMRLVFFRGFSRGSVLAVDFLRRACDPALAMELLAPLNEGDDAARTAASSAILETVVALAGPRGRRALDKPVADALDGLICGAMNSYETHRRQEIVFAAAILHNRRPTKLRDMLSTPGTPQRLAVQGVPHHTNVPLVRRNLIDWLDSDLLGRQSARCLDTLHDPSALGEGLSAAHLLMTPSRRKMMANAERAFRCLPDVAGALKLSESAQHWLPRYVAALPISAARQIGYLADLIALPSPAGRWRAVDILLRHRTDAAQDAVRFFARDSHPQVAIAPAAQVLNESTTARTTELRSIARCQHRTMSARARLELASQNTEQFAEFVTELPRHAAIAAARRLAATQKSALMARLKRLVQDDRRDCCLAAIYIIRRMRWTVELEGPLLSLLQSDDAQRCSAAASALGDYGTVPRIEILTRLMDHEHARVRANAVEALGHAAAALDPDRRAATIVEVIVPHADSRSNRERANALVAWIRAGDVSKCRNDRLPEMEIDVRAAVNGLRTMLRDDDPLHRVSAIWAAGRSPRLDVVGELELLTRRETLAPVRERAVRALRRVKAAGVAA